MNPTQTHKVFGQSVRGMLAVAIAASAVTTASVKAGPTEVTIAAAMTETGLAGTITDKTVKAKNTTDPFVDAMIASFAITFSDPNIAQVANKITASKLFAFYQKGLPDYSPNLAQLAINAAFTPSNSLKYKDLKARVKDAAKIAGLAIKNGMKSYPKGTRNVDGQTGFFNVTGTTVTRNLVNIAYEATDALAGADDATRTAAVTDITKSLVKAAAKFKKTTTEGTSSVVVGFIAQLGGSTLALDSSVGLVATSAAKNAKKDIIDIAEAVAYAAYSVYRRTAIAPVGLEAWLNENRVRIFDALALGYGKSISKIAVDVTDAIDLGAQNALDNEVDWGAGDISPGGVPLDINKGGQNPVTTIQNS